MADDQAPETPSENPEGTPEATDDGFQPIKSQEDLNRILNDRIRRERAKTADYQQLKNAAKELETIRNRDKSESDKLRDQIKALETDLVGARREALVFRISAQHGVSDEDAELFLTGSDEETLTRQAQRLTARRQEASKRGPIVPGEGNQPTASGSGGSERETIRGLFNPQ